MKVSVVRVVISFFALAVVVSFIAIYLNGCKPNQEKPYEKIESANPKLYRIALYGWGESMGCVEVDYLTGNLKVRKPSQSPKGPLWITIESKLSPYHLTLLQDMLSQAKIRSFSPTRKWYQKELDQHDTAYRLRISDNRRVLYLRWENQDKAIEFIPLELRGNMPENAQKTYNEIDALADLLVRLDNEYSSKGKVISKPLDSEITVSFKDELTTVSFLALPND